MKVTVCQLADSRDKFASDWSELKAHLSAEKSQLVLLPEMPFSAWFARRPVYDADIWQKAVDEHDAWLERLPELAPTVVLGSRPVNSKGRRLNEGFR